MKQLMAAVCGTLVVMGMATANAQNQAELPDQAGAFDSMVDIVSELRAVQMAEMTLLDTQQKFFEIVKMSFEGGRELTNAFSSDSVQAGADLFGTGVTVVMDAKLAQLWLRGAAPSAMLVREVWAASQGNVGVMRASAQRVWGSLVALWQKTPFVKNFATTAALGTFAYIQYETYWVINMSEEQYQASLQALDLKIDNIAAQKQEVANKFDSLFVK